MKAFSNTNIAGIDRGSIPPLINRKSAYAEMVLNVEVR